jgi:hypothetical protein
MMILKYESFSLLPRALTEAEEAGLVPVPTYYVLCDVDVDLLMALYKAEEAHSLNFEGFAEWAVRKEIFWPLPSRVLTVTDSLFSVRPDKE